MKGRAGKIWSTAAKNCGKILPGSAALFLGQLSIVRQSSGKNNVLLQIVALQTASELG